jgi:hypothetical protein
MLAWKIRLSTWMYAQLLSNDVSINVESVPSHHLPSNGCSFYNHTVLYIVNQVPHRPLLYTQECRSSRAATADDHRTSLLLPPEQVTNIRPVEWFHWKFIVYTIGRIIAPLLYILVLGLNHESAQFLISEQLGPHIGPTRPQDRLFSLTLSNPLVVRLSQHWDCFASRSIS